jgi:hypothetical protein
MGKQLCCALSVMAGLVPICAKFRFIMTLT